MKRNALRKDFLMELKKTWNRFFSIVLIVALGVAFFAGVRAASPDMNLSADLFYDNSNLMDIRILGTLGMTKEDVQEIQNIDGVKEAIGGYNADVLCNLKDAQIAVRLMSAPEIINRISVDEGRMPEAIDECLVDNEFLTNTGYKVGDEISLTSGTDDPITDTVKNDHYTIVGSGRTAFYLSLDRGTTKIGNGDLNSFIVLPTESFSMKAYSEVCVTVKNAKALLCSSTEYEDLVKEIEDKLKDISGGRCQIRYQNLYDDGQKELTDAKTEITDNKKKLEDAELELKDGESKLQEGYTTISDNEKKLEDAKQELADSKQTLEDGKEQLADGYAQLESAKAELDQKSAELEDGKAQLSQAEQDLEEGKQALEGAPEEITANQKAILDGWTQIEAQRAKIADGWAQINAGKAQLEAERQKLLAGEAQLDSLVQAGVMSKEEAEAAKAQARAAFEAGEKAMAEQAAPAIAELTAGEQRLKEESQKLDAGQQQIDEASAKLLAGQEELAAGEQQIAETRETLSQGEAQIADGYAQLEDSRKLLDEKSAELEDGEATWNDGKKTLEDGITELTDAKEEIAEKSKDLEQGKLDFEEAKKEADPKIADAEIKIADGEKELADLTLPEWFILNRQYIQTYVEYQQDSMRIEAIGKVFPAIFFLVAALICLTTMTRMVEEERVQIGTLKALGYGKFSIAAKYIFYAFFASLIGSLAGLVIGQKVLPPVIIHAYGILYNNLPEVLSPLHLNYSVSATLLAIACTVIATIFACYKELSAKPATLMRPTAPKNGKRVLLERITFIWKHLNFTNKSTIRNLFRYKKRFLMTVFGIGGCMGLLLVGFGLKDSIKSIGTLQFGEVRTYDGTISVKDDASIEEETALAAKIKEDTQIKESLPVYETSIDAEKNGVKKSAYMVVPKDITKFKDFINLRNRITKESYVLDENGIVISEKLAKLLKVKEGDTISLQEDDTHKKETRISHITENYFFHYVYMSPKLYASLYQSEPEYKQTYLINTAKDDAFEKAMQSRYMKEDQVSEVTFLSKTGTRISNMLRSMDTVIYVLVISAGLLAFVVLYNLNNINMSERKRELATLKVLGFYDLEVSAYVLRENIWLTLIGSLVGVLFGWILHRFVILTAEIDIMMFGRNIDFKSYIYSICLTFFFSLLVNLAMHFKLKKIDMVESMKSVE